jgi:hypothetical protein
MTNATSITVNSLTADGVTYVAGDVLDTGTVPVTIYGTAAGRMDRVIVAITNGTVGALVVNLLPGDNPPAFRSGIGTVTGTVAAGSVSVIGPFDGSRFIQDDRTFGITFTPTGVISATVRCYKLPIV